MLDAFIIDELRRREKEERSDEERPRLELPLENGEPAPSKPGDHNDDNADKDDDSSDRGVVIIDMVRR